MHHSWWGMRCLRLLNNAGGLGWVWAIGVPDDKWQPMNMRFIIGLCLRHACWIYLSIIDSLDTTRGDLWVDSTALTHIEMFDFLYLWVSPAVLLDECFSKVDKEEGGSCLILWDTRCAQRHCHEKRLLLSFSWLVIDSIYATVSHNTAATLFVWW